MGPKAGHTVRIDTELDWHDGPSIFTTRDGDQSYLWVMTDDGAADRTFLVLGLGSDAINRYVADPTDLDSAIRSATTVQEVRTAGAMVIERVTSITARDALASLSGEPSLERPPEP